MSGEVIVDGKGYACAAEVVTWHRHGMQFAPPLGARRRWPLLTPIDLFVVHVTGGENPPSVVYEVLRKRALGVEFMIAADGVIWQFCDPYFVDTFDAGHVNARSVGVEIVNHGWTANASLAERWSTLRPRYETKIHGRKIKMAASHPAQVDALVALADTLTACPLLAIPRRVPRDSAFALDASLWDSDRVAKFAGVIGHLHLSGAKIDPGTDVFAALAAAGYK